MTYLLEHLPYLPMSNNRMPPSGFGFRPCGHVIRFIGSRKEFLFNGFPVSMLGAYKNDLHHWRSFVFHMKSLIRKVHNLQNKHFIPFSLQNRIQCFADTFPINVKNSSISSFVRSPILATLNEFK